MVSRDAQRYGLPSGRRRYLAHPRSKADAGVESNSRLTGSTALALLILLAVEGATILQISSHVSIHVFVGMLLIPPVVLKIGSTSWRFARYYSGSAAYVRKGPPPPLLRLLGPFIVILTLIMLGSGVVLVLSPKTFGGQMLFIHKASFVLWFIAMAVHVLGHLAETARLAPLDWVYRTRSQVAHASARQWALVASLAVGLLLGVAMIGPASHFLTNFYGNSSLKVHH